MGFLTEAEARAVEKTFKVAENRPKQSPVLNHYRRPDEFPFTEEEAGKVTIIHGGLTSVADRLIAASLRGIGYKAQPLEVPDPSSLDRGREFCDAGLCNPTYYTVGNLVKYLEYLRDIKGIPTSEILEQYIFLTAGSCGPCRFGMYEYEYRYALKNAGFDGFRVVVFQMYGKLDQSNSQWRIGPLIFHSILNSIILADQLNSIRHSTVPYQLNPGETEQKIEQSTQLLVKYLEKPKSLNIRYMKKYYRPGGFPELFRVVREFLFNREQNKVLEQCRKILSGVQVYYNKPVPVVKITGEFWAQTTEGDGNYHIFDFLEKEGCEVLIEPVSSWVLYLLWSARLLYRDRALTGKKGLLTWRNPFTKIRRTFAILPDMFMFWVGEKIYNIRYNNTGKKLGGKVPPLLNIEYLAQIAEPYMSVRFDAGEGHLEVAKNIYYSEKKYAHMVLSLKPFGCMPSTISDSIQSRVVEDFPSMVFLPLETSGEGKINALSRVQMALSEARVKANHEYREIISKREKKGEGLSQGVKTGIFTRAKNRGFIGRSANILAP